MPVITIAIGGIAFRYIETRMVATAGETLALTAAEVSNKLDRVLFAQHGDVQMIARAFSAQPDNREFQSTYLAWMKASYSDYLWIGVTNARGQVVVATDPVTVGRDYSAESWFESVRDGRGVHMGDVEPFAVMGGPDAVAMTAPITGPRGEFLGVVTTRVGIPGLENVMTGTLLAFRQREGFWGALEYQFLSEKGVAFIDSALEHKGHVNLKELGLPSALLSEGSLSGYVEEEHQHRGVPVITGYARTQGLGKFKGLQWTVLMRMDRHDVLTPIREVLWKLGLAGGARGGSNVWTLGVDREPRAEGISARAAGACACQGGRRVAAEERGTHAAHRRDGARWLHRDGCRWNDHRLERPSRTDVRLVPARGHRATPLAPPSSLHNTGKPMNGDCGTSLQPAKGRC